MNALFLILRRLSFLQFPYVNLIFVLCQFSVQKVKIDTHQIHDSVSKIAKLFDTHILEIFVGKLPVCLFDNSVDRIAVMP